MLICIGLTYFACSHMFKVRDSSPRGMHIFLPLNCYNYGMIFKGQTYSDLSPEETGHDTGQW